jgi:hypothetical protein
VCILFFSFGAFRQMCFAVQSRRLLWFNAPDYTLISSVLFHVCVESRALGFFAAVAIKYYFLVLDVLYAVDVFVLPVVFCFNI